MTNINDNSLNTKHTEAQIGKIQENSTGNLNEISGSKMALGSIQPQRQAQYEAITANALDIQAIYAKAALLTSVKAVNTPPAKE